MAILMVLASIVVVQVAASWAKSLFDATGPTTLVFLRQASAAVILAVAVRPRLTGHSRRDWLTLAAYTSFVITMNFSIYQSMARIPVGMAVTIEFLGPLAVALITGRGVRDLLWVLLAGLGVGLLGWSSTALTWPGVAFALIAAAAWAGYILITPAVGRRWRGVDAVAYANGTGALLLLIPCLAWHGAALGQAWVWGAGIFIGLANSVIPYSLELQALRHLDKRSFSIMMSLEPACAALMAFLLLGERLTPLDLAAMACVTVASVAVTWGLPQRRQS